jgi:hypothetical protein
MTDSKKPTHRAFIVKKFNDKEGTEKSRWLDIGSVWTQRDGKGFDVNLEAVRTSQDPRRSPFSKFRPAAGEINARQPADDGGAIAARRSMLFQSFKTVARQIFRPLMLFFDRRRGRRGSQTAKPITLDEAIDLVAFHGDEANNHQAVARKYAPMARAEKRRKTRAEVRRQKAKAGRGEAGTKKPEHPHTRKPRPHPPPREP